MSKKILVIGESCEDVFNYGSAERLCPDVPAPVFKLGRTESNLGMAGNTVANLKALGSDVDSIHQPEKIIKTRYVDDKLNYTFLRVDEGENIITPFRSLFSEDLKNRICSYDAVIISDYGKGFLSELDIQNICDLNKYTFIDTKKVLKEPLGKYCSKAFMIKINSPEFEAHKSKVDLTKWRNKLIVTLGDKGCMFNTHQGFRYFSVDPVKVFDLSGAGDTFLAALVWKYLDSNDIIVSIKYANLQASMVVQQKGVSIINDSSNLT